jgi:hypothetical protein
MTFQKHVSIPPPPHAALSQNGQWAAHVYGARLLLIEMATGQTHLTQLPHEASKLAWSPDANHLSAANHQTLSLFDVHDGLRLVGQTAIPTTPHRLTTDNDGSTAASFIYNDEEGVLGLWHGQRLTPLLGADLYSLGETLPDFVHLDAANGRVLVYGLQGAGAFGGSGAPYLHLFAFATDLVDAAPLRTVWQGEGIPFALNGVVMPLASGAVGVYHRAQLSVHQTPDWAAGQQHALQELETVVCSPDGRWLAWLWNSSAGNAVHYHLAKLRLGETTPQQITFADLGAFARFAINNDGAITLVYGEKPNTLRTFKVVGETLQQTAQINTRPPLNE